VSLKVMVVDDDPDVLQSVKAMLEPLACDVLKISDSREATELLEKDRFDGILLAVQMPHLDGFELTKLIRASRLNHSALVVLLGETNDSATMRQGFKAGASCFIGKPLDQKRLYALIKAMRGPMLQEKRRHVRLPFWAMVKCRAGAQEEPQFISKSLTLSESGMSLDLARDLEQAQELEVEFSLPNSDKPVKANARVVRTLGPNLVGVEFLNLEAKGREAIQRYVEGVVKL
jgi:DNA-binding response OmpR family regulator